MNQIIKYFLLIRILFQGKVYTQYRRKGLENSGSDSIAIDSRLVEVEIDTGKTYYVHSITDIIRSLEPPCFSSSKAKACGPPQTQSFQVQSLSLKGVKKKFEPVLPVGRPNFALNQSIDQCHFRILAPGPAQRVCLYNFHCKTLDYNFCTLPPEKCI